MPSVNTEAVVCRELGKNMLGLSVARRCPIERVSLKFSFMTVGLLMSVSAHAQHQELIGVPVYAGDGVEVGHVADVSSTGKKIDALRVSRGAPLGLGERIVIIPQSAFMIQRGSVILPDLRSEDLDRFPDASSTGKEEADDR